MICNCAACKLVDECDLHDLNFIITSSVGNTLKFHRSYDGITYDITIDTKKVLDYGVH
jgi:hypothetical protein